MTKFNMNKQLSPLQRALYRALLRKSRAIDNIGYQHVGRNMEADSPSASNSSTSKMPDKLWIQDSVQSDYNIKAINFSMVIPSEALKARVLHRVFPQEILPLLSRMPSRILDGLLFRDTVKSAFRSGGYTLDHAFSTLKAINDQVRVIVRDIRYNDTPVTCCWLPFCSCLSGRYHLSASLKTSGSQSKPWRKMKLMWKARVRSFLVDIIDNSMFSGGRFCYRITVENLNEAPIRILGR
jgi:hypothetical protein